MAHIPNVPPRPFGFSLIHSLMHSANFNQVPPVCWAPCQVLGHDHAWDRDRLHCTGMTSHWAQFRAIRVPDPVPWKALRISRTPIGVGKIPHWQRTLWAPYAAGLREKLGPVPQVTQWAAEGLPRGQAWGRPCPKLGPRESCTERRASRAVWT